MKITSPKNRNKSKLFSRISKYFKIENNQDFIIDSEAIIFNETAKNNLDTDNKYIVYKLENNEYAPQFIISSDGTEEQEDFNLLLNSHEEFLRPYFILPFKTEVLLNYKDNEQTTEKLILVNATFEDKKEELSKLIPHINFNI